MPGILSNIKKFVKDANLGEVSLKSTSKNISSLKPGDIVAFRYTGDEREALLESQLAPNVPGSNKFSEEKANERYKKSISSNLSMKGLGSRFNFLSKIKARMHAQSEKRYRWKRALLRRPHRVALIVGGFVSPGTNNRLVACFVLVEGDESKVNPVIMEMAVNKLYNRRNLIFSRRLLQGIKALFNAEDYRTFNLVKMDNLHSVKIKR